MHNGFVHTTGNNFLNPIPVSTWVPLYPDPSIYGPSNEWQLLGLFDFANDILRNTFRANPLSRLTAQQIGSAATRQTAALGTQGVDLAMLQRRLTLNSPVSRPTPRGQLLGRLAAPLYFAETLGGSTPSPTQAQAMVTQPFTPPAITTFLQNLFGIVPAPTTIQSPQSGSPSQVPQFSRANVPVIRSGPRSMRSARGGGGGLKV